MSFLGSYDMDWEIGYEELMEPPKVKGSTHQIQILTKVSSHTNQFDNTTKYLEQSQIVYIVKNNQSIIARCRGYRLCEMTHCVFVLCASSLNSS